MSRHGQTTVLFTVFDLERLPPALAQIRRPGHVKPTRGDAVRRHGVEAGVDVAPGERNGVCSFFMLDLLIQNLPWPIQKRCFNPCLWEDVDNHPGLQTRSVDRRGVVRRGD